MTESNEGLVQVGARVPAELHADFAKYAEGCGMTISSLLRELMSGVIERRVTIAPSKHLAGLFSIQTTKE